MTTGADKVIAQVRDVVAGTRSRTLPYLLHVGSDDALRALSEAAGWRSTHTGQPMTHLYGVPVVVGGDKASLPLGDREWRLFGSDDRVISSGTL